MRCDPGGSKPSRERKPRPSPGRPTDVPEVAGAPFSCQRCGGLREPPPTPLHTGADSRCRSSSTRQEGGPVAKGILMKEFHVTAYAARGLPAAEYDAMRQALT